MQSVLEVTSPPDALTAVADDAKAQGGVSVAEQVPASRARTSRPSARAVAIVRESHEFGEQIRMDILFAPGIYMLPHV